MTGNSFVGVDQDRPSTWVRYKTDFCQDCFATCCTMPLEVKISDLIRLGLASEDESPKKVAKKLIRDGFVKNYRASSGLFMMEQKKGRDCVFLGSDRRCTVYEKRPDTCRGFPTELGPRVGFCPYKRKSG